MTSPSGAATQTTYRGDGRLDTVTAPAGTGGFRYTTYGYDADGLVAQIGFVDGSGIAVKRDSAGRIAQVDAGAGAWTVGYDPTTGAATTFDGPGAKLQRTFDGSDVVGEAWTGPIATSVTRRLDGAGRDAADTVAGSPEVPYTYDAAGRLIQAGALTETRDGATGLIRPRADWLPHDHVALRHLRCDRRPDGDLRERTHLRPDPRPGRARAGDPADRTSGRGDARATLHVLRCRAA